MNSHQQGVVARRVFIALADQTRCSILEALLHGGAQSASHLAAPLGISRQAVAKHLLILGDAGLVRRTRDGKNVVFGILSEGLIPAEAYLRSLDPQESNAT